MQITEMRIKIKDLFDGYVENEDEGVKAYGGKLDVRPAYQREFVYKDRQQQAVITSVLKGLPLNIFYIADRPLPDGTEHYEVIDGQQRILSICHFLRGDFSLGGRTGHYYEKMSAVEKQRINEYELVVYVCTGNDDECLDWFRTINIVGEKLNEQELRNATYTGPWLYDAKRRFSKRNCAAYTVGADYMSGSPIRQDYLETALRWVSRGDIERYMAEHKNDADAQALYDHFDRVIEWVKQTFPRVRKEMKGVDWGALYDTYKDRAYIGAENEKEVSRLYADVDVTDKKGIYEYVLGGSVSCLNIRAFDEATKATVYERQGHKCPRCIAEGKDKEYKIGEMDADHIVEWVNGGHTVLDNCQMLCRKHNRGDKSWKG